MGFLKGPVAGKNNESTSIDNWFRIFLLKFVDSNTFYLYAYEIFCCYIWKWQYKQGPTRHRPMAHPVVLNIFPTPQRLQNMPLIADGSAVGTYGGR